MGVVLGIVFSIGGYLMCFPAKWIFFVLAGLIPFVGIIFGFCGVMAAAPLVTTGGKIILIAIATLLDFVVALAWKQGKCPNCGTQLNVLTADALDCGRCKKRVLVENDGTKLVLG